MMEVFMWDDLDVEPFEPGVERLAKYRRQVSMSSRVERDPGRTGMASRVGEVSS